MKLAEVEATEADAAEAEATEENQASHRSDKDHQVYNTLSVFLTQRKQTQAAREQRQDKTIIMFFCKVRQTARSQTTKKHQKDDQGRNIVTLYL